MLRERELAEAVREMREHDGITGRDWDAIEWRKGREKAYAIADKILADSPSPQQESATVCEMRECARAFDDEETAAWANALADAEQAARNLAEEAEELKDQICRLERIVAERESWIRDLEPRQPAPSREVDWVALGKVAQDTYLKCGGWVRWHELALAVVAAYLESQKGAATDGD